MENNYHKNTSVRHLRSAGGVIFKRADNSFDVALIAVKNSSIWTIPKGIIDEGEQKEDAAIREVREETGLIGEIIDVLGDRSYWFYLKDENVKCFKTVSYFLMQYISGSIDDHCSEVDEAKWFNINDAIKLVSYKNDKEILQIAKKKLEEQAFI